MTPPEYASLAYADYRAKLGLSWQEDELDAEKFMVSVVERIQQALAEAGASDTEKHLMQDTSNGQHSGQIELSVGVKGDEVAVDFGALVRHISLSPDTAKALARLIIKTSRKIKRGG